MHICQLFHFTATNLQSHFSRSACFTFSTFFWRCLNSSSVVCCFTHTSLCIYSTNFIIYSYILWKSYTYLRNLFYFFVRPPKERKPILRKKISSISTLHSLHFDTRGILIVILRVEEGYLLYFSMDGVTRYV